MKYNIFIAMTIYLAFIVNINAMFFAEDQIEPTATGVACPKSFSTLYFYSNITKECDNSNEPLLLDDKKNTEHKNDKNKFENEIYKSSRRGLTVPILSHHRTSDVAYGGFS